MLNQEFVDSIVESNTSKAKEEITKELNERSKKLVNSYKKAAMAEMFGGVVVEEKDVEMDDEMDKESDDQKEGKGKESGEDDKSKSDDDKNSKDDGDDSKEQI